MARKKSLMERMETIHTLMVYMDNIDEVDPNDTMALKNIVHYQYGVMLSGNSLRWYEAPRNDRANLGRLYRDVMAGKFD